MIKVENKASGRRTSRYIMRAQCLLSVQLKKRSTVPNTEAALRNNHSLERQLWPISQ